MKYVIVTGSRDHKDKDLIWGVLAEENPDLVCEGGAKGADAIAHEWAKKHGKAYCRVPALWKLQGNRAGPIRNAKMADLFPTAIVLAFPVGPSYGTRGCIKLTKDRGMKVRIYESL